MKTSSRTTLPLNPHEQPVHEVKYGMIFRCYIYCAIVCALFFICDLCWECYLKLTSGLITKPAEEIITMAMISLGCALWVLVMAKDGDMYFYERYVEIRRLLPFMKRHVISYDKMHVHISRRSGFVHLNHYETLPSPWKSPYTWLKVYNYESASFSGISNPEILEFLKTKAQSVNLIKMTTRTTLPGNTHEQPLYAMEQSRFEVYFAAVLLLLINGCLWLVCPVSELIKDVAPEMVALHVIFSLADIVFLAIIVRAGDIYFYDRYVEMRRFLPFMKRSVIYYDKMHVHVAKGPNWFSRLASVTLSHYKALPKFLKSPYTWLKAYYSENIGFSYSDSNFGLIYDSEVLEFVKTKAQSVNYL